MALFLAPALLATVEPTGDGLPNGRLALPASDLSDGASPLWDRVALPDYSPSELTWRARIDEEGGFFRVYRAGAHGEPALVTEIAAHPGSDVYRFRDTACFEGRCVYELAYVLPSGQEFSLGAVRRDGVRSHDEGAPSSIGFALVLLPMAIPGVFLGPANDRRVDVSVDGCERPRREPRVPPPNASV